MSDAQLEQLEDLDQIIDSDDAVGQTSDEAANDEKSSKKLSFNIYDGMLLLALCCVTVATVLLLFELRFFGNYPSVYPWRTNEVLEGSGLIWRLF